RNRTHRNGAWRSGSRTDAPATADASARALVLLAWPGSEPGRRTALRLDPGRLAGGNAGRHHDGHVPASPGIPADPDRVHGHGSLAFVAAPRPDPARVRHRNTGRRHG